MDQVNTYLNVLLGIIPCATSVRCRDGNLEKVKKHKYPFNAKFSQELTENESKKSVRTIADSCSIPINHGKLKSNEHILLEIEKTTKPIPEHLRQEHQQAHQRGSQHQRKFQQ